MRTLPSFEREARLLSVAYLSPSACGLNAIALNCGCESAARRQQLHHRTDFHCQSLLHLAPLSGWDPPLRETINSGNETFEQSVATADIYPTSGGDETLEDG